MKAKIIISIVIIIAILIGFSLGIKFQTKQEIEYVYVKFAAEKIAIDDPRLISAIIKAESKGNPKAVSKQGAYGLMQIRYEMHKNDLKQFGIFKAKDLFHPDKNIKAGKFILTKYYKACNGDLKKALMLYSGNAKWYPERVLYYAMEGE